MEASRPLTVSTFGRVLRHHWRVIAAGAVVGLLLASLLTLLLRPTYSATAVLTVSPVTVDPFGNDQVTRAVDMESERSTALSSTVAERAVRELGPGVTADDLRESLKVTVPPTSLVLALTSTADEPARAAEFANAQAQAYLDDRAASAADVSARIAARLQSEIDAKNAAWARLSSSEKTQSAQAMAVLRERVSALTVVGMNPGRLITRATPPGSPSSLSNKALLAGGLGAGLLVGVMLALLRERTDRRVGSGVWLDDEIPVAVTRTSGESAQRSARQILLTGLSRRSGRVVVISLGLDPSRRLGPSVRSEAEVLNHPHQVELLELASVADLARCAGQVSADAVVVLELTPGVARAEVADVLRIMQATGRSLDHLVVRTAQDGRGSRRGWRARLGRSGLASMARPGDVTP